MDAATFHDRVWAAIRDKYQSEVSGGGEMTWSCTPLLRPLMPHKGTASNSGTGPPWPAGPPQHLPPQLSL